VACCVLAVLAQGADAVRILMIYLNRLVWPEPAPPIGAAWVAEGLRRDGHEVQLLDLMFADDAQGAIDGALASFEPELIALSIRNIDSTWMAQPAWSIPVAKEITSHLTASTDAPVLLGGAGPSLVAEETLRALGLEVGVVGEGELVAPALVRALAEGRSLDGLPGVVQPGKPILPPAHEDIWDHFAPAHDLVNYEDYVALGGGCGVQTKRGCAFQCIYCNYPLLEGKRYRRRNPERIADEFESVIRDQGIVDFGFTDSVFSFPRDHAREVCEAIERRDMGAKWTAYVNPADLKEDLVAAMARSGCHAVELGVDVADEEMLARTKKGFGLTALEQSVQLMHDHGIAIGAYALLGGPGETRASAERTLAFLEGLTQLDAVIFTFGMRVYPGTELETLARSEGQVAADDPLLEPRFYVSSELSDADLTELADAIRERDRWLAPEDLLDEDDAFLHWAVRKFRPRPIWRMAEMTAKLRRRNREKKRRALKRT